ncbi:hypothetical protein BDA99DRAFT_505536, partial [Phascolomyces articulosus]
MFICDGWMDETIRHIALSILFYIFISLLGALLFVWYSETEVSLLALVHLLSLFCFTTVHLDILSLFMISQPSSFLVLG